MIMEGVREHREEYPVEIATVTKNGLSREVVLASVEGGFVISKVDLLDLISWIKENRPELLK